MSAALKMTEDVPHKLILIDGYGFVFRAYHAMARSNLTRPDGTPVGAVYAFTNMLIKTITDHASDYIAVVFDAGKDTFRNEIYSEYKANRPPAPDDLIPQFPLVRQAAQAMNLSIIEKAGYEADDLIATYTKRACDLGHEVVIISSDKDLMQLVGEGVCMYDPLKGREIRDEQVLEKFGVAPDKVLDVLSLMGDSSDNIPGVPGIGPKTAAELINQYGSLDAVLERAGEIKQNKRRETLIENADKARLSRDLVSLHFDVPIDNKIEEFAVKKADGELTKFLKEQGFRSLVARAEKVFDLSVDDSQVAKSDRARNFELLSDIASLAKWPPLQKEIDKISINIEYNEKTGDALGVSVSINEHSAYVPFGLEPAKVQTSLFGDAESQSKKSDGLIELFKALKPLLEDRSIIKIGHSFKAILKIAKKNNVNIEPFDDIMIMSYSLEAGLHKHDLDNIITRYHSDKTDDLVGVKSVVGMEAEKAMHYACEKSEAIYNLHNIFSARIFEEKIKTIYEKIEKPMAEILAKMENAGIKIDAAKLKEMSDVFAKDISGLEKEVYDLAGCEFNIGSPKQMGEVLFDKLGVDGGKKSKKTGAYSTDVKVLQNLAAQGYEIADKILQWRHFSKIKSTYADSLPKQIKEDGRVHTNYEMAVTSTGRLSSRDPNLQNIPIRSEEGNKIREAFVAERGFKLISADYSQIELRLLAHIADIDILKEAFKNNYDIHSATASQMFGVPIDKVDSDLRRKAKTINFGIIYGISAFGLSERLGITRGEAADYIKKYFKQYPGIEAYMKETVEFARKHYFVKTIWGRKCFVNGINDKNAAMRQFSERAAINAPLQGAAADIIKKAMVDFDRALNLKGFKARMLLQVHDELIIEAPEAEAKDVAELLKATMENVISLSVPITVDVGVGDNWREIH